MNAQRAAERPLRIALLSVSAIPDDPRVRRQGDLFADRGWDVVAIGLPGARSLKPSWRSLELGALVPVLAPIQGGRGATPASAQVVGINQIRSAGLLHRILHPTFYRAVSRVTRWVKRAKDTARVYVDRSHAEAIYWDLSDKFSQLYDLARHERPDIWLANDWTALPIARQLAAEQGVPYAYDTHELAVDEYAERRFWRLTQRPVVAAVERAGIADSAVTSCVSQGIADRLHKLYGLREKPLLIRNMPHYQAFPHRPCGETIEVLYHGVVYEGRGLEACIDSVALWRPEFRLTIRGPAPVDYLAALRTRIEAAGLGDRVVLAPPVPMIDLVDEAARFDIGLFALPCHSQQNVHVLPNKFFEYTMAGLALCVSDLPEMTALLRQHDLGRLIPEVTPQAIAAAINGFDRAAIDAYKGHALEAAKVLNWEAEADRFFAAIEQAVPAATTAPRHAAR